MLYFEQREKENTIKADDNLNRRFKKNNKERININ